VIGHFDLQGTLDEHLGQLLEQAILAYQVFRFRVIGKQAVRQLDQFRIGLGTFATFCGVIVSLIQAVSCLMAVYTKIFTPS
jgi:hypothetical protein